MAKVALINIQGNLSYESDPVVLLESFINSESASEYAGLLCWISSGGGSLCVAQDLVDLLGSVSLPSVAMLGEVCASAAYYLALGFDHIVARPGSLVGGLCASIEVANHFQFYERVGVTKLCYSHGPLKRMLSPYSRELAPGEEAAINDILTELDSQFHEFVAKRRPSVSLGRFTDGRLITGTTAHRIGLVDTLGGLTEAKVVLAKLLEDSVIDVELIEAEAAAPVPGNAGAGSEIYSLLAGLLKL